MQSKIKLYFSYDIRNIFIEIHMAFLYVHLPFMYEAMSK